MITIDELAAYCGLPDLEEPALAWCVDAAIQHVRSHCHRSFELSTGVASSRDFRPAGRIMWVDDFWDPTGLIVEFDGASVSGWSACPVGSRMVDGTPGVFTHLDMSGHRWVNGVYTVTARWGWAQVPPAVRQAALEVGKDLVNVRLTRFGASVTDVGIVGVRANRVAAMLLAPFVRWDRSGMA